jgi:hypothetical protein
MTKEASMKCHSISASAGRWLAGGVGLAAASYAAYVGIAWSRYGERKPAEGEDADPLLDGFLPVPEAGERHQVRVAAPAEITLAAAREMRLEDSCAIRGIFKARALVLGAEPDDTVRPRGLVEQVKSLGWGVLAESPGREIVFGAVTKPWDANPVFRSLPAGEFAAFDEPGYVKIVWNLRADPVGPDESVFRTETRVATTDARARERFRWYWSFFSPGIWLIRRVSLGSVRGEAERRSA